MTENIFIHETDSAKFVLDQYSISDDQKEPVYAVINALESGVGSVLCKACNQEYQADQLTKEPIGHGTSPFNLNTNHKKGGFFKNLFSRKQKLPGMSGGVCFKCPKGHELISARTWMT